MIVVSLILALVTLTGQPVVGILGGPENALRRRLLALIGKRVNVMRPMEAGGETGAGALIVSYPMLEEVTLEDVAGRPQLSLEGNGSCLGSGGLIGCTCRTSSTKPTPRAKGLARDAGPSWRPRIGTSPTWMLAAKVEEGMKEIALPLVPALRRVQISESSARESTVKRGPKLELGEMLRIQFEGGSTRLGRRPRRGCKLPMQGREFGGLGTSLGKAKTEGGGARKSGCRRATHIFRYPYATTLSELPSGRNATATRMRDQDRRLRNASTR